MRKKTLWLLFLLFLVTTCLFGGSLLVHGAANMQSGGISEDPVTLYRTYKNFSFPMLTKEVEGLNPLSKVTTNIGVTIKEVIWNGCKLVGQFSAKTVGFLFDYDPLKVISKPIVSITNELAKSLLGLATTVGISVIALIMVVKFAMEQNFKRAALIFVMALLVVTSFIALANPTHSKKIMRYATDMDTVVTSSFVGKQSMLEGKGVSKGGSTPGERIEANIFKANVVIPYLIGNYGTSDLTKLGEKPITYDGKKYNRVGLVMKNADANGVDEDFLSDVAEAEYKELHNKNVDGKAAIGQALLLFFFLLLNVVQFIIFFLLFLLKNMLGFMLKFLFPISLFVLLFAMFSASMNPFKNIFKGYFTISLFKGAISFLAYFFASYMIIAYRSSEAYSNVFVKIILILMYICMPLILYIWRKFLFSLIQASFGGRINAQQMTSQLIHPRRANRMGRGEITTDKAGRKNKQQGVTWNDRLSHLVRKPRELVQSVNKGRQQWQMKRNEEKADTRAANERVAASHLRKAGHQKVKDYEKVFQDVPIGHGKHGEMTDSQIRKGEKEKEITANKARREQQERLAQQGEKHKQRTATHLQQRRQNKQHDAVDRLSKQTKSKMPVRHKGQKQQVVSLPQTPQKRARPGKAALERKPQTLATKRNYATRQAARRSQATGNVPRSENPSASPSLVATNQAANKRSAPSRPVYSPRKMERASITRGSKTNIRRSTRKSPASGRPDAKPIKRSSAKQTPRQVRGRK